MKNTGLLLLAGLVTMAGCSGDAPGPTVVPTPGSTSDTYSVSLTTNSSSALLPFNSWVTLTAAVSVNGSSASDGTSVNFELLCNGTCFLGSAETGEILTGGSADVLTSGGSASILFSASGALGDPTAQAQVTVQVGNAQGSVNQSFAFFTEEEFDDISVSSVSPSSADLDGGEIVTIQGRGFNAGTSVTFDVIGIGSFSSTVVDLDSLGAYIVITAPTITGADDRSYLANLDFSVPQSDGSVSEARFENLFTFQPGTSELVEIFNVLPNRVGWEGGDQVTVWGRSFAAPIKIDLTGSGPGGSFSGLNAEVISVSDDGSKAEIITPRFANDPPTGEMAINMVLRNGDGSTATANGFFIVEKAIDELTIARIEPDAGPAEGGYTATITGLGFEGPMEVLFNVGGVTLIADMVETKTHFDSVSFLVPGLPGSIDTTKENPATVTLIRGKDTLFEDTANVPGGFRYMATTAEPFITRISPDHGVKEGGEEINIFGANFIAPVTVDFIIPSGVGTLRADSVQVSSDGTQLQVITPQVTAIDVNNDLVSSVRVCVESNTAREKCTTKNQSFVFTANAPSPAITTISPTNGPIEGGTRVTIFGAGFDFPTQVLFTLSAGDISDSSDAVIEADVISVSYNEVVIVTPSIVPFGPSSADTDAEITVRNVETGLEANSPTPFNYGSAMFITGNIPTEGAAIEATEVRVFGGGFRDPIQAFWGGDEVPVIAISGTQVVVRMDANPQQACGVGTAQGYTFTHLDTGLTVTGGAFNYVGDDPLVVSVNPSSSIYGAGLTVDIFGLNFNDPIEVNIGDTVPTELSPTSETAINDFTVPDPLTFNSVFAFARDVGCIDNPTGVAGFRMLATGQPVTVTNVDTGCSDTLVDGFSYLPVDTSCQPQVSVDDENGANTLAGDLLAFPDVFFDGAACDTANAAAGAPSGETNCYEMPITITNDNTGTDVDMAVTISGDPAFTICTTCGTYAGAPITMSPGGSQTLTIRFLPLDQNATLVGLLTVTPTIDGTAIPIDFDLEGDEVLP